MLTRKTLILFLSLIGICLNSFSQTNVFTGTWQMIEVPSPGLKPIYLELSVAAPEKNLLYPAHITLKSDSFSAGYDILLVKKNPRQLSISRNKYAVSENPFSLQEATFYLNGNLDISRDLKGQLTLHLNRIQNEAINIALKSSQNKVLATTPLQLILLNFLKKADIRFTKINDAEVSGAVNPQTIVPPSPPVYFGVADTVYVNTREAILDLSDNKKDDIVSVGLNGVTIIDLLTLSKKPYREDILLDTGLNILTFFADNFGSEFPNAGKLNIGFNDKKLNLDFTNPADSAATFIVAKIYCQPGKLKDNFFRELPLNPAEKLQANDKLIGNIVATAQQVKLAIWDDAVEDGDSISININGRWIARGFPVKKNPQFIMVTLKPGPNTINFIADNLGSIPPNTSILEIIEGKKRKSYTLEANLGENNLVKIFYEIKGDK
ncbi:MAG: hypothetical protein ABIT07_03985 [Ferruginibacter sp.]